MTPEFPYVQLPGAYRGFFRKASLWEGVDHVLSVSGSRFHEEYRRFYYRDVQAFVVERTARAGSLGWWSVLLILLIIAIIATVENDPRYSWVALVVLSLLVIIRLEITFRRSCRCSIQTAVSRELLPSLMRRAATEAVIARLQTRIAAEQGELPGDIPASEDDVTAAILPPDPANPAPSQVLEEAATRERRQLATRSVNFAILALFVLLFNSVFTFWASWAVLHTSPLDYLFLAAGLVAIFLSMQDLARPLQPLKGLRGVSSRDDRFERLATAHRID